MCCGGLCDEDGEDAEGELAAPPHLGGETRDGQALTRRDRDVGYYVALSIIYRAHHVIWISDIRRGDAATADLGMLLTC